MGQQNPLALWLLAVILTVAGAFALYAGSWVVMTLVAAIAKAGAPAWGAVGGLLFIISILVAIKLDHHI